MSGRCRRTRKPSTPRTPKPGEATPYFDTSFGIRELVALTETDLQQLDDLDNDPEGTALWWGLRRLQWAEEDAG